MIEKENGFKWTKILILITVFIGVGIVGGVMLERYIDIAIKSCEKDLDDIAFAKVKCELFARQCYDYAINNEQVLQECTATLGQYQQLIAKIQQQQQVG